MKKIIDRSGRHRRQPAAPEKPARCAGGAGRPAGCPMPSCARSRTTRSKARSRCTRSAASSTPPTATSGGATGSWISSSGSTDCALASRWRSASRARTAASSSRRRAWSSMRRSKRTQSLTRTDFALLKPVADAAGLDRQGVHSLADAAALPLRPARACTARSIPTSKSSTRTSHGSIARRSRRSMPPAAAICKSTRPTSPAICRTRRCARARAKGRRGP